MRGEMPFSIRAFFQIIISFNLNLFTQRSEKGQTVNGLFKDISMLVHFLANRLGVFIKHCINLGFVSWTSKGSISQLLFLCL